MALQRRLGVVLVGGETNEIRKQRSTEYFLIYSILKAARANVKFVS